MHQSSTPVFLQDDPSSDIPDALPSSYNSWLEPYCADIPPPGEHPSCAGAYDMLLTRCKSTTACLPLPSPHWYLLISVAGVRTTVGVCTLFLQGTTVLTHLVFSHRQRQLLRSQDVGQVRRCLHDQPWPPECQGPGLLLWSDLWAL